MTLARTPVAIVSTFILSAFAFAACGGGEAAGLKYRVSDKELRGLTGDGVMRIDGAKGDVAKLEDALATGDLERQEKQKDIAETGEQKKAAGDRIEAANDRIENTTEAQEKDLAEARRVRDERVAQAKKEYDDTANRLKDKYAADQQKNRQTLADAKTSQALAGAQQKLLQAELAETKARQNLRKQEIMVAKAQLEVVKFEELLKMTGVVGPKETQRKVNLEQQAVNEQKKLIVLQQAMVKAEAATAAERANVEKNRGAQQ